MITAGHFRVGPTLFSVNYLIYDGHTSENLGMAPMDM
ncbi:hypothetical protein SCG7086_BC_00170 [Chlamydiales bacterium SCGC AG-110-P3]|nr:hypothetical protein SCG7086_BC_00170 [Chlamydiales bacterium SCGC AG-110-P3]